MVDSGVSVILFKVGLILIIILIGGGIYTFYHSKRRLGKMPKFILIKKSLLPPNSSKEMIRANYEFKNVGGNCHNFQSYAKPGQENRFSVWPMHPGSTCRKGETTAIEFIIILKDDARNDYQFCLDYHDDDNVRYKHIYKGVIHNNLNFKIEEGRVFLVRDK